MIKINEGKSYVVKETEYLSMTELKKMRVGSELYAYNKSAVKRGNNNWDFSDRIETFHNVSDSHISDYFEDEEIQVHEA